VEHGTLVDMHMHTVLGAYDSGLQPDRLAHEARGVGLTGVAITEHDRMWDTHTLSRYREEQAGLLVYNGMEVTTDMGHILAFGLPSYAPGIHRLAELRRLSLEVGGYLVAAHPFRYWFEPVHFTRRGQTPPEMVPEVLAKLPLFDLVDALEVLNGANSERENRIALAVANRLGKPGVGGSDCHSAAGIGCACTVFERAIEVPSDLLHELHAGRFLPGYDLPKGELTLFTEPPIAPTIDASS
jgi:predicted metal-dependent phosphoesterase TrpH